MKLLDMTRVEIDHETKEIRGQYALIEGENGYIVTDNECVHQRNFKDEPAAFDVYKKPEKTNDGMIVFATPVAYINLTLPELRKLIKEDIENPQDWIHYFGIKDRIKRNYALLKESIKTIGAKENLPIWDKRIRKGA